jgi:hypothetical protein
MRLLISAAVSFMIITAAALAGSTCRNDPGGTFGLGTQDKRFIYTYPDGSTMTSTTTQPVGEALVLTFGTPSGGLVLLLDTATSPCQVAGRVAPSSAP